jgi:histidine triad (HIT) family protein
MTQHTDRPDQVVEDHAGAVSVRLQLADVWVVTGAGGEVSCRFCEIANEIWPAVYVRKWPDAVAIQPLNPVVPGHVLVIPRAHVNDVTEDPIVAASTTARAAELAVPPCNLITSAGAPATQTVFHLHVHVVPRAVGDGLALPWTERVS